jgi:DNA-binding NtrC family response regulator
MMRFSVLFAGEKIDIPTLPTLLLPEGLAELVSQNHADGASSAHPEWIAEIPERFNAPDLSTPTEEVDAENEISPLGIEHILRLSNSIGHFPPGGIKAKEFMADIEIRLIKAALAQSNGSVSQAAQLLHMQRTTLIQKIARYNIATAFI